MTNKTHVGFLLPRLIGATVLSVVLAACSGDGPSTPTAATAPTAPAPPPPGPVTADISISGGVYDLAHQPLRGARVEVTEGKAGDWCEYDPAPVCVVAVFTDDSGRFRFLGPFQSVTRLRASMEGYLPATLTVDSSTSNSAIEFRLEPSVAPGPLATALFNLSRSFPAS